MKEPNEQQNTEREEMKARYEVIKFLSETDDKWFMNIFPRIISLFGVNEQTEKKNFSDYDYFLADKKLNIIKIVLGTDDCWLINQTERFIENIK